MPNREDERWAGQKDDLCYCYTHKRYYDDRVGCQRCYVDHLNLKIAVDAIPQTPELEHCPQCKRKSLFWNKCARQFECLEPRCRKTYSEEEYKAATALRLDETLKCLRCGLTAVKWNRHFVYFECGSCHKTFTREEMTASLATDAMEKKEEAPGSKTYSEREFVAATTPRLDETLKCPRCGQISLIWVKPFASYQCANCRKAFTKDEVRLFLASDTEKIVAPEPPQEEHPKEQVEEPVKEVVPSQMANEAPRQPQTPTPLQVCPNPKCKLQSLALNRAGDTYECLNADCRMTFPKALVDRRNQQIEAAKKELEALQERDTKAWMGNQYYDDKKKEWRDGQRPRRIGTNWLWIAILLIVIIVVTALILTHFFPDSRFAIFIW
jgi:transposase-like protein